MFNRLKSTVYFTPSLIPGKGLNAGADPSLQQRPILVRTTMQENPYACIKRNKEWNDKNLSLKNGLKKFRLWFLEEAGSYFPKSFF